MKQKILPVAILLMILAIISQPSQSNEYTGKAIQQPCNLKAVLPTPAETTECTFTESPATILLSL